MRALFLIGALLAFAGCKADTEDLSGKNGGRDASPGDADSGMRVIIDGGAECFEARDCPVGLPYCDDVTQCFCGCFTTCQAGSCIGYCDDSPMCFADAGIADAGITDAGTPPTECLTSDECTADPLLRACVGQGAASCAFHACVTDCLGPRLCLEEEDGCVSCSNAGGPITSACPICAPLQFDEAQVEETSCESQLALGLDLMFTRNEDCSSSINLDESDRLVSFEGGLMVGYLQRFGSPCLVTIAPTGAFRTTWACPDCSFTLIHR